MKLKEMLKMIKCKLVFCCNSKCSINEDLEENKNVDRP